MSERSKNVSELPSDEMTIPEVISAYDSRWVLMQIGAVDEYGNVVSGHVLSVSNEPATAARELGKKVADSVYGQNRYYLFCAVPRADNLRQMFEQNIP